MENKAYDKIIRENLKEFIDTFIVNVLGIKYKSKEDATERITRTLEREPDFVYLLQTENDEELVLHLEFQSTDEPTMLCRMFEYAALLFRIHKIQVKQYVVYLGKNKVVNMKTISKHPDFTYKYNIVKFYNVPYTEMLNSEIAEQVILAILCNYQNVDAHEIVRKIIERLLTISKGLKLQKYLRQLRTLARLTNQQNIVKEEEQNMITTIFDVTKDPYFIEGIEKGIEKGVLLKSYEFALKLIQNNYTNDEQISDLTGLHVSKIILIRQKFSELGNDTMDWINKQLTNINSETKK